MESEFAKGLHSKPTEWKFLEWMHSINGRLTGKSL